MLTPFSFPDAQIYLRELNGSDDAVVVLRRAVIAFDDAFDTADETHKPVPEHTCIYFWVSCCLLDAVVNGTDYPAEDRACGPEYDKAVAKLKAAFGKKKLFSTKPVIDMKPILREAFDNLAVFTDDDNVTTAQKCKESGEYEEFNESIIDLSDRLQRPAIK